MFHQLPGDSVTADNKALRLRIPRPSYGSFGGLWSPTLREAWCFSLDVLTLKLAETRLLSSPWPWPETLLLRLEGKGSSVREWGLGQPLWSPPTTPGHLTHTLSTTWTRA